MPDWPGVGLLRRSRGRSWKLQVEVEIGFAWHATEGCNLSASRLLAHPRPHPSPLCDLSRHLTYVLSSIQFFNMRHVTHTLHVARCARHLPVSVLSGECTQLDAGPAHCALYMYELVCFPVLTCCSLTRAASSQFPIALLPSPMGFHAASSFYWFLFFWVAFCGLTSATRQPSAIVLWVWGADSLRAFLLGVAACGDMWPTGGAFPADLWPEPAVCTK